MDDLREVIARQEHAKELREINRYDWEYWPETRIREAIEANWPYEKGRFLAKADAALAAIKQAGFVVVPAEPTEAMTTAGFETLLCNSKPSWADAAADAYRAMIEASNAPT